jgi:hypothetical protein
MAIAQYIKETGRGRDGARPLSREQAADLFGQVLDGSVSELEVGAFCLAMRIKGETAHEMAGFLDATHARLHRLPASRCPTIALPSYNGARKLPVLTPLLALLLAREGLPPGTPVAVVQDASLPTQGFITATRAGLAHAVRAERISSPAIIVVGEVTRAAAEAVLAASASEPIAAETQRHRAG